MICILITWQSDILLIKQRAKPKFTCDNHIWFSYHTLNSVPSKILELRPILHNFREIGEFLPPQISMFLLYLKVINILLKHNINMVKCSRSSKMALEVELAKRFLNMVKCSRSSKMALEVELAKQFLSNGSNSQNAVWINNSRTAWPTLNFSVSFEFQLRAIYCKVHISFLRRCY